MACRIQDHPAFDREQPEQFDWTRVASLEVSDCACRIKDAIKGLVQDPDPPFEMLVTDGHLAPVLGLREALNIIASNEEIREFIDVPLGQPDR